MSTSLPRRPVRLDARTGRGSRAARVPADDRLRRSGAIVALGLAGALAVSVGLGSGASAQGWRTEEIEPGTKPALALTPDGRPVVIYMLERQDGWVRVATLEDDGWRVEEIARGYFYGPPDVAVGPDGVVHGAYHDHQDSSFQPDKGDAVHVRGEGGEWIVSAVADRGHDGWDNRIATDAAGRPHMVAIDPLEFDGSGVEYYVLADDGTWAVEQVGSGPQTYKYATSIAVDPDGTPWITYHDGSAADLVVAHRREEGIWTIETVDERGDTGLFSEIAIDADGGQHVSYVERTSDTGGVVRYAFRSASDAAWETSEIDTLDALFLGFTGARNLTSIALDADGRPAVAYSDERVMRLATRDEAGWRVETIAEAGEVPFGQIVSLAIDAAGQPHVAYALVTSKGPLDGTVAYATRR